jgi:hypothetical protein
MSPPIHPALPEEQPRQPKEAWVNFTAVTFIVSLCAFYGLSFLNDMKIASGLLATTYSFVNPLFGSFFRLLKITTLSAVTALPLTIFTLL